MEAKLKNGQQKPYFWQIAPPRIKVVMCNTYDYKGAFMSSATSIRLDEELKDRLKTLADDRHRSAHALMLEAITEYIDREEKRSQYLRDGQAAWQHYQETGLQRSPPFPVGRSLLRSPVPTLPFTGYLSAVLRFWQCKRNWPISGRLSP
ncbi:CopG family ribbon-helix-helix protein [Klebsiella aerogenes]|uniref:CopG family ribbon-helix-helix protein n=5 Tax=Bacteria TaxID=2 RepID=UPI002A805CAB|nr:ribbon-helix-helix protein, CopG family [Klebsiella aerogenes]WPR87917.1 ribbon-helix-helix protein, CopG family [Klebsiella aerogenes]